MAMNPDVHDPSWMRAREKIWKRIKSCNRGVGLSAKDLECIRRVCFGERVEERWPDPDESPPYWVSFWEYFPIQNREFWREIFLEQRPRYAYRGGGVWEYLSEGGYAGRDQSDWNDGYCGWDLETSIEFGRYILGDRYQPEGYTFEGIAMPYPNPPGKIYTDWLRNFCVWAYGARPDCVALHQLDLWISCLPYIPSFLFSRRPSRHSDLMVAQHQLSLLISYVVRPEESFRRMAEEVKQKISDADIAHKVSVIRLVRDRLLMSDVRNELKESISLYGRSGFEPYSCDEEDPLPESLDLSNSELLTLFRC